MLLRLHVTFLQQALLINTVVTALLGLVCALVGCVQSYSALCICVGEVLIIIIRTFVYILA